MAVKPALPPSVPMHARQDHAWNWNLYIEIYIDVVMVPLVLCLGRRRHGKQQRCQCSGR
jgi:hypothetical protein